ncbi:hypothetical protein J1N51_11395 [Psychrosphaera ytuae]|uniref:Uncharacterized protein n=1 Tax=Psychrosphaera ytuae TaxID=2820710 RepID=A0A975HHN5_9GAMM|nr:hypothetical protein [Psychrosphaera ytuae]QTH63330.1 hypothetical protein J1N51_11395 [Psychrosphaera ytuae]
MANRLIIEFSEEATENYLRLVSRKSETEVEMDMEPSGVKLEIDIGPAHYGYEAEITGKSIGEVFVKLEHTGSPKLKS